MKDNVIDNLSKAAVSADEMQMKGHIDDAQLLLSYAAEEGIKLDNTIIDTIIKSKYYLRNNDFDQKKEMEFWIAFNGLSKIIQPVSIASLKATKGREKTFFKHNAFFLLNRSEAASTVFLYQALTLLVLISLLAVQIYWLVGSIIITHIVNPSFDKEIEQLEMSIERLGQMKNKAKDAYSEDAIQMIENIKSDYTNRKKDINLEKESYYLLLKEWRDTFLVRWIFSAHNEKKYEENGYIEAKQAAQLILQPIQQYILPLLYGWIGALAYVLRSINREIAQITYTHQSKEHYRLRAQLGTLSGLAVGWFFSVDSEQYGQISFSFGSLSPLALSFLAGYSVELLFSAMDKIVETFSDSSSSPSSH
ncbi:hypothetical protein GCAAIG_02940 [Candidatus Electronema halotolerans]